MRLFETHMRARKRCEASQTYPWSPGAHKLQISVSSFISTFSSFISMGHVGTAACLRPCEVLNYAACLTLKRATYEHVKPGCGVHPQLSCMPYACVPAAPGSSDACLAPSPPTAPSSSFRFSRFLPPKPTPGNLEPKNCRFQ